MLFNNLRISCSSTKINWPCSRCFNNCRTFTINHAKGLPSSYVSSWRLRQSPTWKIVTLEMGGKSPKIVFNDADLDPSLSTSLPHGILSVLPFICQSFLCSRIPILQLEPQVVLPRVSLSSLYNEFLERFSGKQAKSLRFGDTLKFCRGVLPMSSSV